MKVFYSVVYFWAQSPSHKGKEKKVGQKESYKLQISQSSVNTGTNCQHNKHAKVQITKHPRNPALKK